MAMFEHSEVGPHLISPTAPISYACVPHCWWSQASDRPDTNDREKDSRRNPFEPGMSLAAQTTQNTNGTAAQRHTHMRGAGRTVTGRRPAERF